LSTGAADDLAKATQIARAMVTRYGMEEGLGHVSYESDRRPGFLGEAYARRSYADETARDIDKAVQRLLEAAFRRAREVLDKGRGVLDESAEALLKQETLGEVDLESYFVKFKRETSQRQPAIVAST
jgi:cell division protease FtsH